MRKVCPRGKQEEIKTTVYSEKERKNPKRSRKHVASSHGLLRVNLATREELIG